MTTDPSREELRQMLLAPLHHKLIWVQSLHGHLVEQLDHLGFLAASDDVPVSEKFEADILASAVAGLLPEVAFNEVHVAVRAHQRRARQRTARAPDVELAVVLEQRGVIEDYVSTLERDLRSELAEATKPIGGS